MLIDPLEIHYSRGAGSTTVSYPKPADFINQFDRLLLSVGWRHVGAPMYATGTFTLPLGAPITRAVLSLPLRKVCAAFPGFVSIGDQAFSFYDPFTEVPAAHCRCAMVRMETTVSASLRNLADAITTSGLGFTAVASYVTGSTYQLTITARADGPDSSLITLSGDGRYTEVPRPTSGGGFRLESGPGASIYRVEVTASDGRVVGGNLLFKFLFSAGGSVEYQLLDGRQGGVGILGAVGTGAVPQYTIIANPHGFVVMDEPRNTTGTIFRTISLFAMAPYIPTAGDDVPEGEVFYTPYAVFVVGPNGIGGAPSWTGPSAFCLDQNVHTNYGNNPWPRLLALRSPGPPLLTPHGKPLIIGPYVMFGQNSPEGSPAWVVGKLWDCALVTDNIGTGAMIQNRPFLTLGGDDGSNATTCCTLMMASGATLSNPKSGTLNLFGDGVTWVSGDFFSVDMVGNSITIAGQSYLVKAYIDNQHLTLTSAKTILSGATYSVP